MNSPLQAGLNGCAPRTPRKAIFYQLPSRLVQLVVMLAAGAWLFFRLEHYFAAYAVWALAALFLAGLLGCGKIAHGFDRAGAWLGRTAATGITWLLLAPMYYVVFGLGRLGLRLRGCDPMRRSWDPAAVTYWDNRPENAGQEHWSRQY
ncbi:MAG: hypothetical protein ABIH24_06250 [Verrucomicrobiota bacterium]